MNGNNAALIFQFGALAALWVLPIVLGIKWARRKGVSPHWMWFGVHPITGWIVFLIIRYKVTPPLACGSCGSVVPLDARFCPSCKAAMKAVPLAAPAGRHSARSFMKAQPESSVLPSGISKQVERLTEQHRARTDIIVSLLREGKWDEAITTYKDGLVPLSLVQALGGPGSTRTEESDHALALSEVEKIAGAHGISIRAEGSKSDKPPGADVSLGTASNERRLTPGAEWCDQISDLGKGVMPVMVTLPRGKFLMGSTVGGRASAEIPVHEVRIDHVLAIGKYPITFAEWDAAAAVNPRLSKSSDEGWGRARRPVINISWSDAQEYIAWLNESLGLTGRPEAYRLPSEAEWEYACRAGTVTPFSCGETISTNQAQYSLGNYGSTTQTAPVGSFPANAFGLHDMHGNVWEWCEDAWHRSYEGAPADGSAWVKGAREVVTLTARHEPGYHRVLRGGSYCVVSTDLRSAYRNYQEPVGYADRGFRLARTLAPRPQTTEETQPTSSILFGRIGEPFCSQTCKDSADGYLGHQAVMGVQGPCTFCLVPVRIGLEQSTGLIFVYRKQIAYLCKACEPRAREYMQGVSDCAMCRTELPVSDLANARPRANAAARGESSSH